jgi:hypothetical protein
MDKFTTIVLIALTAGVLWLVCAAWLSRMLPIADVIDKRRNEKWAAQLSIEEHDIPQMIDAANTYRRRRGLPEVTVEELRAQVGGDLHEQVLKEATKQLRAQTSRPANLVREQRGF